ncbi:pyridoxamine 5'-phosphate oxidase family protein [Bacillus sp. JCM 19034]|uniref:pyridoxamine 5'-phosphate oxidase family protein n=1 Tax=Bacillus sp. JCM 19034 TaxID=1481928 RepID=UPI000785121F|nr:pyridoxamine 5'-phosphate oxidase family protein [Bacillus sp. JCM 19034]
MIQPIIEEPFQFFIESQPMIVIGTTDSIGNLWSSLICGESGFIRVINDRTLQIHIQEHKKDGWFTHVKSNFNVGLLVIEFSTRIRVRINGIARIIAEDIVEVKTEQVYSNCPKYIQSRQIYSNKQRGPTTLASIGGKKLSDHQKEWIGNADTFFLSSSNSEGKTDVSHRGGHPGFIEVMNDRKVIYPDYVGNMMFNTLGNIVENERTGLLFIDFEHGHTLQLTGESSIIWELTTEEKQRFPGAMRLIAYDILNIRENQSSLPYKWDFINESPFNPK